MEGYWKTKEDEVLKISEMKTSHIKNCVNMLNNTLSDLADKMAIVEDIYVPAVAKLRYEALSRKLRELNTQLFIRRAKKHFSMDNRELNDNEDEYIERLNN